MMDASDMAVKGAAAALIDAKQVRELILRAQAAWRAQCAAGLCDETFDAWRHGALYDAVRKTSFRAVTQKEYGIALGYFARLAGGSETACRKSREIARREENGDADICRARHVLEDECRKCDDLFGGKAFWYSCSLFEKIHHVSVDRASAKQIWQVIFTLRNRAAAKRNKGGVR